MRALTNVFTRKYQSKYVYLLKRVRHTYIDWGIVAKSPERAIIYFVQKKRIVFEVQKKHLSLHVASLNPSVDG